MIPFNKPYFTETELEYLRDALRGGHTSGNGPYTEKCRNYFNDKYNFRHTYLTTSCTAALEMAAILIDLKAGDEIIAPSYTFVSSVLPFVRLGVVIRFADSRSDHPGMDENNIEQLINSRTKAVLVMHYAGIATDMDKIMRIANARNLWVIEDAAHALNATYRDKPLGSTGHLAAFSFHETKNISCGEGGMLVVNEERFIPRAEIILDKGTNRQSFLKGEVNKYDWVDLGSSFILSDLLASVLYAQLEAESAIMSLRLKVVTEYIKSIKGNFKLPQIPSFANLNGSVFYLEMANADVRSCFIAEMRKLGIQCAFHYQALHRSPFYKELHDGRVLGEADKWTSCLVRLPLWAGMSDQEVEKISSSVCKFLQA